MTTVGCSDARTVLCATLNGERTAGRFGAVTAFPIVSSLHEIKIVSTPDLYPQGP